MCVNSYLSLNAQTGKINGDYRFEDEIINISDTLFTYYLDSDPYLSLYMNDTLAVCKMAKVNDSFYEINSIYPTPYSKLAKHITFDVGESVSDTINLTILTEASHTALDINIYYGKGAETDKYTSLITKDGKGHVCLHNNGDDVFLEDIWISPRFPRYELLERLYRCISSEFYLIRESFPKNTKSIPIYLPEMTDHFFEMHYVHGEYFRVDDGYIIWRGKTFKKASKEVQGKLLGYESWKRNTGHL